MKLRSDSKASKEWEARNERLASKLTQARANHAAWVRDQFPNREDVIRSARDLVDDYEERRGLKPGTITAVFDDQGASLGYFLQIHGRNVDTAELVEQIKSATGEWFEVHRILTG